MSARTAKLGRYPSIRSRVERQTRLRARRRSAFDACYQAVSDRGQARLGRWDWEDWESLLDAIINCQRLAPMRRDYYRKSRGWR